MDQTMKMKMCNSALGFFTAIAGMAVFSATPSFAQQANAPQAKASGWFKTCKEDDGSKYCNVQYRVVAPNGANITSLSFIEITGKVERRSFRVFVPTGRSLPQGIQISVDKKKAAAIPYLFCRPQGCTAEVKTDDNMVNVFKNGGSIVVTTVNFQGKAIPVPVTLKGFTKAFDGDPIDPNAPTERQKTLADQLQKKADEERAKQEGSE